MRSSASLWTGVTFAIVLSACSVPSETDSLDASPGKNPVSGVYVPKPGTTWQWQLAGDLDLSRDVEVYDVDLYTTSDAQLRALKDETRKVFCYFSAGTYEDGRPDSDKLPTSLHGKELPEWPGEFWLDTTSNQVRDVMAARIALAQERGCDGVEPDNVDGYQNDSGLDLTAETQLDFNRFLAKVAHSHGLSIGLKNDLDQLEALVDDFDWALNEECFAYDECDRYRETFIAAGKAVFHAEYVGASRREEVCAVTQPLQLSTLIAELDLSGSTVSCE